MPEFESAHLFDCEDMSDVTIKCYLTDDEPKRKRSVMDIRAHAVLLSMQSNLFKAHIKSWLTTDDSQNVIEIGVQTEAEVKAVRKVVQFIYTGELDEEQVLVDIFDVFRIADKLDVPSCVHACADMLELMTVRVKDVNFCYKDIPVIAPNLVTHVNVSSFKATCCDYMMDEFGDVNRTLNNTEKMSDFATLSSEALIAFLQSDKLRSASETDVLVLVCSWVNENGQQDDAVFTDLTASLRLMYLSPSYLPHVTLLAPWLKIDDKQWKKMLTANMALLGTVDFSERFPKTRAYMYNRYTMNQVIEKAVLEAAMNTTGIEKMWSTPGCYDGFVYSFGIVVHPDMEWT
jgi:hypothetical protein